MSSKIPEKEWSAIVARRESGEAVASIARSYDCSPALIYGILKKAAAATAAPKTTPAAAPAATAEEPKEAGQLTLEIAPRPAPTEVPPPAPAATRLETPASQAEAAPTVPTPPVRAPEPQRPVVVSAKSRPEASSPATTAAPAKPIALTANLDAALRADIDMAIAAFQSAFDAALANPTGDTLETLRRASSDLMRAGARTSIVVERLISGTNAKAARLPAMSAGASPQPAQPAKARGSEATPGGAGQSVAGTVKWFNPEKKFGFVKLDGSGGDVFVHAQALERSGLGTLQEGQRVRLTTRPGPKGPQADVLELT